MAELVYDQNLLEPGKPIFIVHVGRTRTSETILASFIMDLTAPPDPTALQPIVFSGFEHRAGDAIRLAQERAYERGVRQILVVDPFGLLSFVRGIRAGRD